MLKQKETLITKLTSGINESDKDVIISHLRSEMLDMKSSIDENPILKEFNSKIEQLEVENERLNSEMDVSKSSLSYKMNSVLELTGEVHKYISENKILTNSKGLSFTPAKEDLENQRSELIEQIESKNRDLSQVKKDNDRLKQEIELLKGSQAETTDKIKSDFETSLNSELEKQHKKYINDIEQMKEEVR